MKADINKLKQYETNRRYPHQIKFRISEEIYIEINKIAESKGISLTEVCRNRINGLQYLPPLIEFENTQQLIKGIYGMGNNLNQTAKSLNTIVQYLSKDKNEDKFLFNTIPAIFMDDIANRIADKLKIKNPEALFEESIMSTMYYRFLDKTDQQLVIKWIGNKNMRPLPKEEFEKNIQRAVQQTSVNIKKIKEDLAKICQLV